MLGEARDRLGLERVLAIADEENVASTRLLDRLGFDFERMVTLPGETGEVRQYSIEGW